MDYYGKGKLNEKILSLAKYQENITIKNHYTSITSANMLSLLIRDIWTADTLRHHW